ncbi:hypothetical protein L9F63_010265, partial [Diploptera punctata]
QIITHPISETVYKHSQINESNYTEFRYVSQNELDSRQNVDHEGVSTPVGIHDNYT